MSELSLVYVAIGILVIAVRGPLVFAPEATIDVYRRLLATDARVRVMGVVVGAAGLALIAEGRGSGVANLIVFTFGWLMAVGALFFMLIFPAPYRRLAASVLDFAAGVGSSVSRVAGMIGVLIGVFLIYLGFVGEATPSG